MTIGIVMSSTYISTGLMAEFGAIPPSFLPLGNRRLYWHQIKLMKMHCDEVFLTLPDNFELPQKDVVLLAESDVKIIRCDHTISIVRALLGAISEIPDMNDALVVMYGDTLFSNLADLPKDFYSAHVAVDEYNWAAAPIKHNENTKKESRLVVSGLYRFSSLETLLMALHACGGDIIEALRIYDDALPLKMLTDGDWHDFGHTQTYHTSCGLITTQRSFNSLHITEKYVEKKSDDHRKMESEANWFEALPYNMRVYTPTYLGRVDVDGTTVGYRTQNTYLATLSSLATFGKLNRNTWGSIFSACKTFLAEAGQLQPPVASVRKTEDYYQAKTDMRLRQFAKETGFDTSSKMKFNGIAVPSAEELSRVTGQIIQASPPPDTTLIHGDFCFSNIFFDFRSRLVKVIDPRGIAPSGKITVFGDPRYDVAKLSHSAIGQYDAIISGDLRAHRSGQDFTFNEDTANTHVWQFIRDAFHATGFLENSEAERVNHAILVQLFLSMLPLHADHPDRQTAFLANAARLYLQIEK